MANRTCFQTHRYHRVLFLRQHPSIFLCAILTLLLPFALSCTKPSPEELFKSKVRRLTKRIQSIKYDTKTEEIKTGGGVLITMESTLKRNAEDVLKVASEIYSIGNDLGTLTSSLPMEWQDDCAYAEALAYTWAFKFSTEAYRDRESQYYTPVLMTLHSLYGFDGGNNRIEDWTQDRADEIDISREIYRDWFSTTGNPTLRDAQAMLSFTTMQMLAYAGRYDEAIPLAENLIERYPDEECGRNASTVLQSLVKHGAKSSELTSDAKASESAREELERQSIPFTSEEFWKRASKGDVWAVETFLAAGMDPDVRDHFGKTALMNVAVAGGKPFIWHRAEDWADARKRGKTVRQPCSLKAKSRKFPDILDILLDAGADVNAVDMFGETALFRAAKLGCPDRILALLERGANPDVKNIRGRTALIEAAVEGRWDSVSTMLDNNVSVDVKGGQDEATLFEAVLRGDTKIVNGFLKKGINPDVRTEGGFTALMAASVLGYREIVSALLDAGANVNAKDSVGFSALMFAAHRGNTKTARILLESGADPNGTDKNGETALMRAAGSGHTAIAKDLLDRGADVNAQNRIGLTPLIYAAVGRHSDTVLLLLERGAQLDMADKFGKTALTHAREVENMDIVHLLEEAGKKK